MRERTIQTVTDYERQVYFECDRLGVSPEQLAARGYGCVVDADGLMSLKSPEQMADLR
jgi:hypothetical protein